MTIRGVAVILSLLVFGTGPLGAQSSSFESLDGAGLYRAACAACHGADGKGQARSVVGFDTPLPDFTDCSFSTPEPDADWLAVVHQGGTVRAFDRRMPAFGEALTEDALLRVIGHLRGLCTSRSWPRGELNLPRALVTEKAFPENEIVLSVAAEGGEQAGVGHTLIYEQRLGPRSQYELVVPVDLRKQGAGDWSQGLGDVAFAFKQVLFHDLDRGTIVSVAAEASLPTGKEDRGLGKGVAIVEPFAAFGQILPSDGFVQLQSGIELPVDADKAGREAFVRLAIGKSFISGRFGRTWSPMIELLGARELRDGEPMQWDVIPEVQVTLSKRQHIMISAGMRVPVTARDQRDVQVLTYLLWDWFDGGFFDGWR